MEKTTQELLEIYMDMIEKQDDIIFKLTELLRKYTREINHLRNLNHYFEEESAFQNEENELRDRIEEYTEMKD